MIELYPKWTQSFGLNGIALHPSDATVTYTENGQYDLEMTVPITDDMPEMDWGMIVRCPVPKQVIGDISLGTVSYWTVTPAEGAKLYANIPTLKKVSYSQWTAYRNVKIYAVGDKVSYLKKN